MLRSVDDDVTVSKAITNIAQESEIGEGSKTITIPETDENMSGKDIPVGQVLTYRKSTKGAKYIPMKKGGTKTIHLFVYE